MPDHDAAAKAFRLDVLHLVDWFRGHVDAAPVGDDQEIRRIVRDGYHRSLELVPPYRLSDTERKSPAALAGLMFCWTFTKHRVDPRDPHLQERYWGVVARALDEAIDVPA